MDKLGYKQNMTLSLRVKDRHAAVDWYSRHLGFTLLYDKPEIGWAEMTTHMNGINIGLAEVVEFEPCGVASLSVVDIEQARARLEAEGVRFDGKTLVYDDLVKIAAFFDLDNNIWRLMQNLGD